jgi:hypothetical protein
MMEGVGRIQAGIEKMGTRNSQLARIPISPITEKRWVDIEARG